VLYYLDALGTSGMMNELAQSNWCELKEASPTSSPYPPHLSNLNDKESYKNKLEENRSNNFKLISLLKYLLKHQETE